MYGGKGRGRVEELERSKLNRRRLMVVVCDKEGGEWVFEQEWMQV